MADYERVEGAVEEQIDNQEAESKDSQIKTLDEKAVQDLLADHDKKWQSRFDKLLAEKKETEKASKTEKERIADLERKIEIAEKEKNKAKQETLALRLLSDAGIKQTPKIFDRLVGESDGETSELIKTYLDDIEDFRASEKLEEAKRHGVKPRDSNSKVIDNRPITDFTEQELRSMSFDQRQKMFEAELSKRRK